MTDDYTIDHRLETYEQTAERYEASDAFLTDSLDWVGTHAYKYPQLVELIQAIYRVSPEFETAVEDIADGARAA